MTKGFTLAEVLITLGIIGVVAAMTMPSLVGHYRKVEATSRLKKFYSSMEQAIRLSEMENGDSRNWVQPSQLDEDGNRDYDREGRVTKEFFMKYLGKYMKYSKIVEGKTFVNEEGEDDHSSTTVYLADGSWFSFNNGACIDFYYDINGDQKPNIDGRDRFVFLMCFSEYERLHFCGSNKKAFCPYATDASTDSTRAKRLADCKNAAYWCSGLLYLDNWEFKDDYPYKL